VPDRRRLRRVGRLPPRPPTPPARGLGLATALATAAFLPSLLPPSSVRITGSTTRAETIGWPDMVRSVREVWTALPPQQQARAVIFTADFSEAGAINEIGRGELPTAVSSQNNEWFWGPGVGQELVLLVQPPPAVRRLLEHLAHVVGGFAQELLVFPVLCDPTDELVEPDDARVGQLGQLVGHERRDRARPAVASYVR
jgi:hypothetical protein